MANISLTTIMIGIVAFLAVFMIAQTAYVNFTVDNNGTIDPTYLAKYQTISAFNQTYSDFADKSAIDVLKDTREIVTGLIQTVFSIGLGSIRLLAGSAGSSRAIIEVMKSEFPELQYFFWFIITASVIYITYRFLQSARGSAQEP